MIAPNKRAWFQRFFAWHVRRRFLRRFSVVRMRGLDELARLADTTPLLMVANHTAWWDSLVFFDVLYRTLRVDAYALMDAANLRALPLLGWIGAFGVELGDKADGERAVAFGASLLDRPRRAVVIFPQGAERPVTERPLVFRHGAARMAALAKGAAVVPVSLRYEHGKHELPEVLVTFGAPLPSVADESAATAALANAVTTQLDATQAAIHDGSVRSWPVYLGKDAARARVGERT